MSNIGLQAAHKASALRKQAGIKTVCLTPIEKLNLNPTSLRAAINAMCYDCQGRNADPNVIGRIKFCEITECPLFNVRPYRIKEDKDDG